MYNFKRYISIKESHNIIMHSMKVDISSEVF